MRMKHLKPLAAAFAALLFGSAHLVAQCEPVFSFSVYNDGSVSADQTTIYGYTTTEDTSTLCSCVHSQYTVYAIVYDPNGTLLGESEESGFSGSVSALVDGVSGDYQVAGAGTAYCSCPQGYFGGAGSVYPIALTCPTTISLSSQTAAQLDAGNVSGGILTGIGMIAILTVGPGSPASYNGAAVKETITNGPVLCTNPPSTSQIISQGLVCVGNSTFTVGPGSYAIFYGTDSPVTANGQFWDKHGTITGYDVLGGQSANFSCQISCIQSYSACNKPLQTNNGTNSYTLTFTFNHSSIGGTPVTVVSAGEQ